MRVLISLICVCTLFLTSSLGHAAEKLKFGVYTSDKASTMYKTFKPIINALHKQLREHDSDTSIELKIYKTYEQGIEAIVQGEVDFMRMGPSSYILAKEQNAGLGLLAMELRKGKKRFRGVIIVPSDSPINSLEQLNGKRFAFGNRNSTIGRYLAQAELINAGVHGKDLNLFSYLGRHDKVAYAVSLKDFDAGSVKEKTFKKVSKEEKIKALHYFDNVTKPWVSRADLDSATAKSLTSALVSLDDKKALKVLKVSGFAAAKDQDYEFVRRGMSMAKQF